MAEDEYPLSGNERELAQATTQAFEDMATIMRRIGEGMVPDQELIQGLSDYPTWPILMSMLATVLKTAIIRARTEHTPDAFVQGLTDLAFKLAAAQVDRDT